MKKLGVLLGAAALLLARGASAEAVVRRALVIAHNGSDDPSLPSLRFADDDGVLWAETLQRLGVETTLLVDPDEATRATARPVLAGARPPTPDEVKREVARLRAANLVDHELGRQTDVLLVYVGHGNTDEAGRAYFTLAGGRLDKASLYADVVDPLGASYVHLIVDACRASGVVGSRGGQTDAAVLAELRGMLAREQLATRPTVGAVFAESDDGETHEWSRIRAGVFSHVARSGLMGAADINGDGKVEYSELGAFVTASLQGVKGLPARLSLHAFAPTREPRRPLVGPAPKGPSLPLPAGLEHSRISVEDSDGRRLADVRRSKEQYVLLRLPERDVYWIRTPTQEARITLAKLSTNGIIDMGDRELQERGPAEEALRKGLFAVPLDKDFYERYVAVTGLAPVGVSQAFPPSAGGTFPRFMAQRPDTMGGWDLGWTGQQAPLGLSTLATGPTVTWRREAPLPSLYYGARASYGLTPLATDDIRTHRGALLGLLGAQAPAHLRVPLFLEAGAGWGFLGITRGQVRMGDPTVLSTYTAAGVTGALAGVRLRLAATLTYDRVTLDQRNYWDRAFGFELALRR
ncbi:conserved domain protein [Myxococcus xanthus DK 1622]|uniref:Conserved domain protein n=3 Tax=Myxococcus TaxID=32 RepID=Q1CXS3_MYXXD|nr:MULTISPECIES: caspase family protein [Myxococcus]AAL56580.1 unknown [Myxococcus xanthus DK 1622]ABF90232.1 conserved domain protein [Myxococcus xanthus DK 1622]NOJ53407.1 caspase family protein [Myxococcus xanthus]QPM78993.1 caspase family protein [Myxococcus xanthus]QVW68071.1 caspase family protein [Myxococcus xanthus DZ2]